jgi:uncharacterized membrane protein
MVRRARAQYNPEYLNGFRLRGQEPSRLEGFADAVFGFALTLLVVSLDVPQNFNALLDTMRGFPAFALCFLLLALIWNSHYKFCRRFGLDDGATRFLTCVLLFLVLFYVYPLKFLFNLSVTELIFGPAVTSIHLATGQVAELLIIYGLGFAAVYLAMFFLYVHAWRRRDDLKLTDLERHETRFLQQRMLIFVLVGLMAAGLASFRRTLPWSGLSYFCIVPLMTLQRALDRRTRAPLLAAETTR